MSDVIREIIDNKEEKDIKEALTFLYNYYAKQKKEIDLKRDQIAKLQAEYYRDELIAELQGRIKELEDRLFSGESFNITEEEKIKIQEWVRQHTKEKHNDNDYCGAIVGRYSYVFTPTSLGLVGEIQCSCGEKFCFRYAL